MWKYYCHFSDFTVLVVDIANALPHKKIQMEIFAWV